MRETAGVIVYRVKDGKTQVLLVNNGRKWSIPKGKIEKGERRKKAAQRELLEETNICVSTMHEIAYADKSQRERLFCFFSELKKKRRPKPSKEIREAVFVDLDEAIALVERYQRPLLHILPVLKAAA